MKKLVRFIGVVLFLVGLVVLIGSANMLMTLNSGKVATITDASQFERAKYVVLHSPIKESRYVIEKIGSGQKTGYFYRGQLGDQEFYFSSANALDESDGTNILGYVSEFEDTRISADAKNLKNKIIKDKEISEAEFVQDYTPYYIDIYKVGEDPLKDYTSAQPVGVAGGVVSILLGLFLFLRKGKKEKLA